MTASVTPFPTIIVTVGGKGRPLGLPFPPSSPSEPSYSTVDSISSTKASRVSLASAPP